MVCKKGVYMGFRVIVGPDYSYGPRYATNTAPASYGFVKMLLITNSHLFCPPFVTRKCSISLSSPSNVENNYQYTTTDTCGTIVSSIRTS